MAFLPSIFGSKNKIKQIPRYTPMQQQALNQLLQGSLGGLQNILQPQQQQNFDFAPIAQQARSNFAQQTVPTIAERFTSLGGGRLSSPVFAQQLGQAGAGLEEALASLQSQYGLQQQQLGQRERALQLQALLSLLGQGLQPQFDAYQQPAKQGLVGGFLGGLERGLGQLGQQLITGPDLNRLMQLLGGAV